MDTRTKWNMKHQDRLNVSKKPIPNPRLKKLSPFLKGGTALDLACGLGGNSFFMASMNYQVQAMDVSDVAINYIQQQAASHKLTIAPRVCDLTEWKYGGWENISYDLVVITYYLDRSLFNIVKKIINKNGYFFMETYYQSPQTENQGVSNQYKLQPKELLNEFEDWTILFFEENETECRQTIFCQKR